MVRDKHTVKIERRIAPDLSANPIEFVVKFFGQNRPTFGFKMIYVNETLTLISQFFQNSNPKSFQGFAL